MDRTVIYYKISPLDKVPLSSNMRKNWQKRGTSVHVRSMAQSTAFGTPVLMVIVARIL